MSVERVIFLLKQRHGAGLCLKLRSVTLFDRCLPTNRLGRWALVQSLQCMSPLKIMMGYMVFLAQIPVIIRGLVCISVPNHIVAGALIMVLLFLRRRRANKCLVLENMDIFKDFFLF